MIAADASLSSIITSYSAHAAYGSRLHDCFYLGPEGQTFACVGYSQLRFGIHPSNGNGQRRSVGPAMATIVPVPICASAY